MAQLRRGHSQGSGARGLVAVVLASAFFLLGLVVVGAPAVADGTPSQLVFTIQPGGATVGAPFTTQPQVTIEDADGNTVTSDTSAVTLTLTGTATTTLSGCSATTDAGVASFSGCEIDTQGTGYELIASDTTDSLSPVNSNAFDVTTPITQDAPFSGSTTTTGSSAFTDQLTVSGNNGTVTYTQNSGGADLTVSADGQVTTTGALAVGSYTANGTTSDPAGDSGTFTYTLTVGSVTINQASPTSGSTTTTGSAAFTDQLAVSGNNGPVTYNQTTGTDPVVSASGAVTTTGTLAAGTYTAGGTTSDPAGDSGTFTYTLTVGATTITQGSPTSGSTTTSGSAAFTDQLTVSGNNGPVTYTQTTGTDLVVSASGAVTTTGTLAVGTYTASGTTSDPAGDSGTFTYTLTVAPATITQGSPTSGSTTTTGSAAFTDQLAVSGNNGPVTYTQTTGSDLVVSASGAVTTKGTLAAGTHTASGTTSDPAGDSGTFSYTLTVTAGAITQGSPTSGSTTTTGSAAFTDQLAVSGNNGPVTYTQTTGSDLVVSASGAVTTTGTLVAGTYTASGKTSDTAGDSGTFTYALTVTAGTITQVSPTSGSTTTTGSSAFTDQLTVSGGIGAVTYTKTGGSADLLVSASGAVTTTGTLPAGSYTVTGATSDHYGNAGTFSYTLAVSPVTLTQVAPTSGSTTTTGSSTFTDQLAVTGNSGAVTYTQTGGSIALVVSAAGKMTTTGGILTPGNYTTTGTTSDHYGDTGTFSYTLTVSPATIAQVAPTSAVVNITQSSPFTTQLNASGNNGTVTYKQTGGMYLTVSSAGFVSRTAPAGTVPPILPPANYSASGTMSDPYGDKGTFSFTLTVVTGPLTQVAPMSGTTTVGGSAAFTAQLSVTGNHGAVAYTQTSGAPDLTVSPSGAVATIGTLASGSYTATGTETDFNTDGGTFTFTLTVTATPITQGSPVSGSTTTTGSSAFTDQLGVSGNNGPVTYTQTGGSAHLVVSASGAVTTTGGPLRAGPYTATGTVADAYGESGTFSYTLTVAPTTITQGSPSSGSSTVAGSAAFTAQLSVSGGSGTVTYTQSSGSGQLVVSPGGQVTTTGTLAAGTYTAGGTTTDPYGDSGSFTFSLAVAAPSSPPPPPPSQAAAASSGALTQGLPTSGTTSTGASSSFTAQLVVTGNVGPVNYTQGTGKAVLTVSSTGKVTTVGALSVGTYTATGTTSDAVGSTGTFSFTLVVTDLVTLVQGTPTSAIAGVGAGVQMQLAVTNANGTVSYTEASSPFSKDVVVSASGAISANPALAPGTYRVSGTDTDGKGDTGSWTFTLVVAKATTTTILDLSRARVPYGDEQVERLSVTVKSGYARAALTGAVAVKEGNKAVCSITLTRGAGSCSLPSRALNAGAGRVVALYGGSTTFAGSVSAGEALTVAKATSETTLKLSATKVTFGNEQVERLTVKVSPAYAGPAPTGSVAVKEGDRALCVITLSLGQGSCTLFFKALTPGTYSIVATFGGSSAFVSSRSAGETLVVRRSGA